ncbi:MAG: PIN domain-containing protein [Thermomicrobiales bacterium]|nr:PIN domain-containing protein [Thermomicrobiales bacterium]
MKEAFLDTNVLVRHLVVDDAERALRARGLIEQVARGEITVHISETVLFETVYLLEKTYHFGRPNIAESLLALLQLPNIVMEHKVLVGETFGRYVRERSLSFADCHHVTVMHRLGLTEIISFDRDFDRLPDIERIEP